MIETIVNFFNGIVEFFQGAVSFIANLIEGIPILWLSVQTGVHSLLWITGYLPAVFSVVVTVVVLGGVIKWVLMH